ncbi:hypothetical protein IV203_023776 [Nitzschia inconspicua]|uniref:DUF1611 domain-containing protein n=1 Tax=Nitzschia inconspicua TaxID=303405 RepID=A0A9K3KC38_9STRA|nr:hypothetical protein IV203_023776 [Nitzschia inconspicua]
MEKRYIYGSLTRISDLELYPFEVETIDKNLWDTGDYVVGKYLCPKHRHTYSGPVATGDFCELPSGRHRYYMPGDQVIGVLGNRKATQELCGEWQGIQHPDPDGGPTLMDDIDGAGLFGKMTSISPHFTRQGQFEYAGHVIRNGSKVGMKDFAPRDYQPSSNPPKAPTILVVGTSMSCGKSCTARVAIHCLKDMGVATVLGAKLTGAGYLNDILGFQDAGADVVLDFVDVGLPSTVNATFFSGRSPFPAKV